MNPLASISVLLAAALHAALPVRGTLAVDAAASTIRFHVVHKLHSVDGASSAVEGKAAVKEDGTVLAMVRVPVAAFRSGDANRDVHMREALGAEKHPFVVFKGIARLDAGAPQLPGAVTIEGEVELHGVKRPVAVPLSLELRDDGALRVRGRFETSLDAHGVERPSLLFIKIEDACRIDFDLLLREER